MELDHIILLLSTLCFLGGFVYAVLSLRAGSYGGSRKTMAFMAVGFLLQCGFLYLRGQLHGRCPITNPFEILIFVSWAMVMLYFLVGSAFRMSLLGVFTYPMVVVFQAIAVMSLGNEAAESSTAGFWMDFHAAVSLLAYGAFALACVAGVMFLVQDRQLKQKRFSTLFYSLPPVHNLSKAVFRLMVFGLVLLTAGIASAYGMEKMPSGLKLTMSYAVWVVYAGLLAFHMARGMTAKRIARSAIAVFALPVVTLWIVTQG